MESEESEHQPRPRAQWHDGAACVDQHLAGQVDGAITDHNRLLRWLEQDFDSGGFGKFREPFGTRSDSYSIIASSGARRAAGSIGRRLLCLESTRPNVPFQ